VTEEKLELLNVHFFVTVKMSLIVLFLDLKRKFECIPWVEEIEKREINIRRQPQT
jgi:hypothetical protein